MTRYRLKTIRAIEGLLRDQGYLTVREIALELDKEPRVVRNYLRTHKGVFEIKKSKPFTETFWGLKAL